MHSQAGSASVHSPAGNASVLVIVMSHQRNAHNWAYLREWARSRNISHYRVVSRCDPGTLAARLATWMPEGRDVLCVDATDA